MPIVQNLAGAAPLPCMHRLVLLQVSTGALLSLWLPVFDPVLNSHDGCVVRRELGDFRFSSVERRKRREE